MNLLFLIKGLVFGFSIAAPVGPIGVLCIRRTLSDGRMAGLLTGLGAASADAVYGCMAAFGLTVVSSYLIEHGSILKAAGGFFLIWLGFRTFTAKPPETVMEKTTLGGWTAWGSTFFLTLTNPLTIICFTGVFAGLGLAGQKGDWAGAGLLVLGVFCGSALWWLILSLGVGHFRQRFSVRSMILINRLSGALIIIFGLMALGLKTG